MEEPFGDFGAVGNALTLDPPSLSSSGPLLESFEVEFDLLALARRRLPALGSVASTGSSSSSGLRLGGV